MAGVSGIYRKFGLRALSFIKGMVTMAFKGIFKKARRQYSIPDTHQTSDIESGFKAVSLRCKDDYWKIYRKREHPEDHGRVEYEGYEMFESRKREPSATVFYQKHPDYLS
jgi:hypothetical protein